MRCGITTGIRRRTTNAIEQPPQHACRKPSLEINRACKGIKGSSWEDKLLFSVGRTEHGRDKKKVKWTNGYEKHTSNLKKSKNEISAGSSLSTDNYVAD